MHELFMERFGFASLIKINILTIQLRQYLFRKDTVILPLLAVHFICYLGQHFFGLGTAFFGEILFHDHPTMLRHTYFVKFFQVGRIDRQEFNPLIDR